MSRPDWDTYFIRIAKEISTRATCPRAAVGAVIVTDNRILSTGYNGAPAGEPHCDDVGCNVKNDHCTRAVHAETNAIAIAAKYGISLEGSILYCWDSKGRYYSGIDQLKDVCFNCGLLVAATGITRVICRAL